MNLEQFKSKFSTVPQIDIIHIGMAVGVRRNKLMFRAFSDLVAEKVSKVESLKDQIEQRYPHIFKSQ